MQDVISTVQYRTLECVGYPHYRIGDNGSLWRLWKKGWVQSKRSTPKTAKYLLTSLYPGARVFLIHRLVLEAFVGPRPPGMVCRHLNGNRLDNRLSNLQWGTYVENEQDKSAHGTRLVGERHQNASLKDGDVVDIHTSYRKGETMRTLAAQHGVSYRVVWGILRGKSYVHLSPDSGVARRNDHPLGSQRVFAKLAEADIPAIRHAAKLGEATKSLAARFGVSTSVINKVVSRRAWRHVPD